MSCFISLVLSTFESLTDSRSTGCNAKPVRQASTTSNGQTAINKTRRWKISAQLFEKYNRYGQIKHFHHWEGYSFLHFLHGYISVPRCWQFFSFLSQTRSNSLEVRCLIGTISNSRVNGSDVRTIQARIYVIQRTIQSVRAHGRKYWKRKFYSVLLLFLCAAFSLFVPALSCTRLLSM